MDGEGAGIKEDIARVRRREGEKREGMDGEGGKVERGVRHHQVRTVDVGVTAPKQTGLCSRPFVPAAFGPGTICGFCPGYNG